MIHINIYQPAMTKPRAARQAEAEYIKRLSRIARIRLKKLKNMPEQSIYFHPGGKETDSPGLAQLIGSELNTKNELNLVMAAPPASNHDQQIQLLSLPLSPVTESILLLEQVYRAFKILAGEPYHK